MTFPQRRRTAPELLAVALAMLIICAPASTARAHPADMYAHNFTVLISAQALEIEWQILPGPFLADAVWAAADLDQSGEISASEAAGWIAPFVSGLSVGLDGRTLRRAEATDVKWPATVDGMRTAEDRIRFSLRYAWPADLSRSRTLEIHAAHLEANSLNWFAVNAEAARPFQQPEQDNGKLSVVVDFLPASASAGEMTSWNSGTPNLPGFASAVKELASLGNTSPAPSEGNSVTATLTSLVRTQEFSPIFLSSAFLLSLVLGSLHALTPGHGKALVGAYLVGSQGRTRDAVFLGAIVTLTHTGSVVLLGLVTLLASHYVLPALLAPWLEIISGVLIIAFGINLLIRRRGGFTGWFAAPARHEHGHSHAGHAHPHAHTDEHDHQTRTADHAHGPSDPASPRVTPRSLLAIGISGGLVPCPDAIAILLVAVAVNRIPFGMLLIVSFSLGLALVLIGMGVAMVNGVRLIARSEAISRFAIHAPIVSAVVVTSLGAALTISAVRSLRFGMQVVDSAAQPQVEPSAPAPESRLLYIASDKTNWDQLFIKPLRGGAATQLTHEPTGITGYSLSPDYQTILYTLFGPEGGTSIWSLKVDGAERRRVLDCPRSECNAPHWYPDGQRLAYERLDEPTDAQVPRFSIWWLDLRTGATLPVFQDDSFASYAPQFSPDGEYLAYVSGADNTLVLFNLKDGSSRSIPRRLQAALPPSWSPDSSAVLYGSQGSDGDPLRAKLYVLATGESLDLGGSRDATDYSAVWSPSGAWIAINRNIRLGASINSNQVWLVRPDGTDARAFLQEPGASYSSISWSPDGSYILYSRYVLDLTASTPGRFDIYMTDAESGESELLVEGGDMPTLLP